MPSPHKSPLSSPCSPPSSVFSSPRKRRREQKSSGETDPTSVEDEKEDRSHRESTRTRASKTIKLPMDGPSMYRSPRPRGGGAWRVGVSLDGPPLPPVALKSFAIESNHPLIERWPAMERDLLDALEQAEIPWSGIDVLRRRRSLEPTEDDDTTIMITADLETNEMQRQLHTIVRGICDAHHATTLKIELVNGRIRHFALTTDVSYDQKPRMGSSIGKSMDNRTRGTFGGYVSLQTKDCPPIVAALTCHHVVEPKTCSTGNAKASPSTESIEIDQPSSWCHEEAKEIHRGHMNFFKKFIAEQEGQIAQEEEMNIGIAKGNLQSGVERVQSDLERYQKQEMVRDAFDRRFGSVMAMSGYRVSSTGCALDWALIKVEPGRIGSNQIPKLPIKDFEDRTWTLLKEGDRITGVDPMRFDDELIQYGAQSGAQPGVFSAIRSNVRLNGFRTREFLVTGINGQDFSKSGDSGAWLINSSGRLVGMLFGGPDETGGPAYVTPMKVIFPDVEETTGYSISLL